MCISQNTCSVPNLIVGDQERPLFDHAVFDPAPAPLCYSGRPVGVFRTDVPALAKSGEELGLTDALDHVYRSMVKQDMTEGTRDVVKAIYRNHAGEL